MSNPSLITLLKQQFPDSSFNENDENLHIGSFEEWDSLGHFHYLMLIEETYGIRFEIEEMSELKSLNEIKTSLKEKNVIFND